MPRMIRNGLDAVIGQQLRALRRQHGLTQIQLGKLLGVTGQQVHKIETGDNRLYVAQARTLARHFSVSMEYFCPDPVPSAARIHPGKHVKADANTVWNLVASRTGFDLMSAFNKLPSERMRKSVVAFVKAMSRQEAQSHPARRK